MTRPWIFVVVPLALAGAVAWWALQHKAPPVAQPAPAPVAAAPAASAPAAAAPVAEAPPPAPAQPLQAADLPGALQTLLGRTAVASLLRADDFPRRVVATVDNLGRSHAPAALWPVVGTPGRFTVDAAGDQAVPALDNAARYAPLVQLAERVGAAQAAALYQRMYPLLQATYEQLGYPGRQFHHRLLEVIALLLATPEPQQPPRLALLQLKGEVASERPWVHYEFVDPALEALPAGQKILLRVGLVNERRLKKKLAELRDALRQVDAR